jgi:hypothetical protein
MVNDLCARSALRACGTGGLAWRGIAAHNPARKVGQRRIVMYLLSLGVGLWWVSHLFRRVAPGARAVMGDGPGKGIVALVALAAVILMVIGYRRADVVPVYALFLFALSQTKGSWRGRLRHPMLLSVVVWAAAHLLVNGDVASLILFGGMGVWAVLSIMLINAQSEWVRPEPGPASRNITTVVVVLVLYGLIAGVHIWTGHNPFVGTYG